MTAPRGFWALARDEPDGVAVVDPDGRHVTRGELMAAANRIDDFFTVGDAGHLDEDGYLFLRDRKSDMIISGGVNVYPAEIEGVLVTHPEVRDVAVFGTPHDDWGEEIKAVIEPADGVAPGPDLDRAI